MTTRWNNFRVCNQKIGWVMQWYQAMRKVNSEWQLPQRRQDTGNKLGPHGNGISSRLRSVQFASRRWDATARAASLSLVTSPLAPRKINGFASVTKVNRIPHFLAENVLYASEVLTVPTYRIITGWFINAPQCVSGYFQV